MKCKFVAVMFCLMVYFLTTAYGGGGNDAFAAAPSINIKIVHVESPGAPFDFGSKRFKEIIEEKSSGRINVTTYPGDLSGDEIEIFEMVQSGNIDIGWLSTGSLSSFVPDLMFLDMPFLLRDDEHVAKVLAGPFGQHLLDKISDIPGVLALSFHVDGWRQITNKLRPINNLDDLKGMKIRTMMNVMNMDMYKALGAVPIPISPGETYTSIETGIVDGQDNGVLVCQFNGYIEIQPYICMISHFYSAGVVVISEKFWDSLSAEDKALVKETAEKAGSDQREWFWKTELALAEELNKSGKITLTYPNDRDAWVAACEPVYEKYYEKFPELEKWVDIIRKTE